MNPNTRPADPRRSLIEFMPDGLLGILKPAT